MAHRIDPLTQYCTRCGAAMTEIVEGGARQLCQAEDSNVVGISHVLSQRRMTPFVTAVVDKSEFDEALANRTPVRMHRADFEPYTYDVGQLDHPMCRCAPLFGPWGTHDPLFDP